MKEKIIRHLSNIPGWRSNRKIVVIESDDWGSIRMPSRAAFERLKASGLGLTKGDSERYNLYDTLACEDDFHALFEVLGSIKDKNGHPAVFTAVSVVANPDFKKIQEGGFESYHCEPFTTTLERYYGHQKAYDLWKEGIDKNLFVPQFHGREHLNVAVWMRALQQKDPQTLLAFEQGFWGFSNQHPLNVKYQAAFDLAQPEEIIGQHRILQEGLLLFEQLFGYQATFFVPPNGKFNNALEETAAQCGIKYMSASKVHEEVLGEGKTRKNFNYIGKRNRHGQLYTTRNCFFEPNQLGKDWVGSCMEEIKIAFLWGKPAVISSHRTNYIGVHDEDNRKKGLIQLRRLLEQIKITWPNVEFMTSAQLGELMRDK